MQSLQKWWPQTVMVWRGATSRQIGHVRALSSVAASTAASPDPAQVRELITFVERAQTGSSCVPVGAFPHK